MVNFNKIKISLILGVVFSSFLFSTDCYVLANSDQQYANGSEEYPYSNITSCLNDNFTHVYVGPGEYGVNNLNINKHHLIGSGVNSTILYSKACEKGP